jgi:hypothetical protein
LGPAQEGSTLLLLTTMSDSSSTSSQQLSVSVRDTIRNLNGSLLDNAAVQRLITLCQQAGGSLPTAQAALDTAGSVAAAGQEALGWFGIFLTELGNNLRLSQRDL